MIPAAEGDPPGPGPQRGSPRGCGEDAPDPTAAGPPPHVAVIGASAGGMAALRSLFAAMPQQSGIAFLLVQHRAPGHDGLLLDLLAQATVLPVAAVAAAMPLLADQILVAPADRGIAIEDGEVRLAPPEEPARAGALPIDRACVAVAEAIGERAIAVILSGTGHDGTAGAGAVRGAGGLVVVQDPSSAGSAGMPAAAIAAGAADLVLAPEAIGAALAAHVARARSGPPADIDAALDAVVGVLLARTRTSFRDYKRRTLARRVERRMGIRQIGDWDAYLDLLNDDEGEAHALADDLMLSVTRFFRDPDAFEILRREVIEPMTQRRRGGSPIRVWVPGCATGEEAYSIAMLLAAHGASFKILASDIDERALAVARAGRYAAEAAADLGPGRLARFFTREGAEIAVRKELRDTIVFARQNLLTDPPFSQLDLISCRNVLIYTEAPAQKRLLALFHFALNPEGCLFLGTAETISARPDLFAPVSAKHRLFRRIGATRGGTLFAPGDATRGLVAPAMRPVIADGRALADILRQALLAEFAPPTVLVDQRGQTLYFHGRVGDILDIPAGEPQVDLLAMTSGDLRLQLREALARAQAENARIVVPDVRGAREGASQRLRLVVLPLRGGRGGERLFAVAFTPEAAPSPVAKLTAQEPLVARLERELSATRDDLESSIHDLAAANEALLTSNEEVTSINEELQSTNEELETSKEELQSLNEELATVNGQLEEKLIALEGTSDDLNNLLNSTDIATLFLDRERRIKRFTPAAVRLFTLIPGDVGRPITDVARRFDDPTLLDDAARVVETLIPIEAQVLAADGATLIRRILPYRTREHRIEGVVITFADITASVRAGATIAGRARQEAALADLGRSALAAPPEATLIDEALRRVVEVLDADCATLFELGFDGAATLGAAAGRVAAVLERAPLPADTLSDIAHAASLRIPVLVRDYAEDPQIRPHAAFPQGSVASGLAIAFDRAPTRVLAVHDRRPGHFAEEDQRFLQSIATVFGLASERQRAARALAEAVELARDIIDTQRLPVLLVDAADRVVSASAAYHRSFGTTVATVAGRPIADLPVGDSAELRVAIEAVRAGGPPVVGLALPPVSLEGAPALELIADVQRLGRTPTHLVVTMEDVSARLRAERALVEARRVAERALAAKTRFLAAASHDLRQPLQGAILFHDLVAHRNRDPDLHGGLEDLGRALEAMRELLEMLLDISRLDAGIVEACPVRLALGPLLAQLAAEAAPQARLGGIGLRLVASSVAIRSDPKLLARILRNLVANALRYTEHGRVLIGCRRRGDVAAIQVWDTGRGISAEDLPGIFEEFQQLANPARERAKGLGLGLAIVRRLATLLGHPVDVRSWPGRGSVFEIQVPLLAAVAPPLVAPAVVASPAAGARRLVILVDDDPLVLVGLRTALGFAGYRTLAIGATEDLGPALTKLDPGSVRCAISDYRMPGAWTGIGVLQRIGALLGRDIPGILLTGDTSPERLREARASGFRLLHKPVGIAELRATIEATPD
jgi:two-component system CheB/CheR fusion protein